MFIAENGIGDQLINHQIKKNSINPKIETIFLGDSSLGNSINADYFSKLSKSNSLNLALSGNDSFAGSFALLENSNFKNLKHIYIISSLDIWRRAPSHFQYNYIGSKSNLLKKIVFTIKQTFNIKFHTQRIKHSLNKSKNKNYFFSDYIKQNKAYFNKTRFKSINYNKIFYLNKIFQYCKNNDLNCTYFHGPIYKEHCVDINSINYINSVNKFIKKKVNYSEILFCMERDQLGDSDDHISPNYKNIFTKQFYIYNQNNYKKK